MSAAVSLDPSPWVERFAGMIEPGGKVLDLACGGGRHGRLFLGRGYEVLFLDRDISKLDDLREDRRAELVEADLEDGSPWPLPGRIFDGIVVTNYLHRPLFERLIGALAPEGVLIYETFALGNERFGKPSNPDFLLQPGELIARLSPPLHVLAYEDLLDEVPKPAMRQRIVARKIKG